MSTSTDAELFWGYCFEEEGQYPWPGDDEEEFDSEERYAIAVGVKRPEEEYTDDPAVKAKYHRFWDERDKVNKKSGCEIGTHCSGDCPMYYVAISASHKSASRGSPEKIDDDYLTVPEAWHAKLKDYCEKMGIKTKQKPRWWLCSYWG